MEILSDATFKGSVSISGGETTPVFETKGWANYSGVTIRGSCGLYIDSDEGINVRKIHFPGGKGYITNWSDLNDILNFAPSSLSSTVSSLCTAVSSNTTKINSVCTTVSSLCTKVNSLCNAVAGVAHFCSIQINFDVAADCTRFYVGRTPNLPYGPASLQMFTDRLPNGGTGYYLKNVDLGVEKIDMGNPYIFVEKSSSFAISASDGYSVRIVY